MKIIISDLLDKEYRGYKVVSSFKELKEITGIQCVVINHYPETDFDAGVYISQLHKSGVIDFIYISSEPSITLKMVINGVGGAIFEEEFYFDDEDELDALIEDVYNAKNINEFEGDTSIAIISDFMSAFARNEEKVKTPVYLEQVNNAINELCLITNQQDKQIRNMGESAIGVFEKASNIITTIDNQRKVLEKQIRELEENQQNLTISPRNKFGGNGITFFPSVSYTGSAKLLLIREYSPCRYLTSFILSYNKHVCFELNKKVKVIFVHQKGAGTALKYNNFTSITQESISDIDLYNAQIVATNNPKQEVLKNLTKKGDDLIIVVDRLYGNQDIMNAKVTKLSAVSGVSDLERYNLKSKDCIFSINALKDSFICIPNMKNYPSDVDTRYATYNQVCKEDFKKLDKLLQLQEV